MKNDRWEAIAILLAFLGALMSMLSILVFAIFPYDLFLYISLIGLNMMIIALMIMVRVAISNPIEALKNVWRVASGK